MITACSIIARNYMAHARVLAESFFAHHPGGSFTVLLVDDERRGFDDRHESFRCLRLSDIGLEPAEIARLVAIYDVTELATAVKPPFLQFLMERGATDVIYLDPDIKLYGSLEEASRLAREHGIVLTPHMLSPVPRDGKWITDFQILSAGVYNLGFIAVGERAKVFIDWWWARTRREARVDPTRMMFTDQRWVDFAPSFFQHFILKDPSYNVAYWNLHERDVTWNGDCYLVNGRPLTFFHFSGFDARKPYLLSKHQGDQPRILLSERPGVAQICREYLASLDCAGLSEQSSLSYGWQTLPSGLAFDRQMRRLYRDSIEAFEADLGPEPPNPFDSDNPDRFMEWLGERVAGGLRPTVSRYLNAIYEERHDLQRAFPDLAGTDGRGFFQWLRSDGVVQHRIPGVLLPPAAETPLGESTYAPAARLTDGVNVAGYFRAELGVGEAARLLTTAIEAAGIPHSTVSYDVTRSRKQHPFVERGDGSAPHDINILCVNADQTPGFARQAGSGLFAGRFTAGYWFWELDRFPPSMHPAFEYVDEVWTATRFVASGIRAVGRRPVFTIPLPIPVPRCSPDVTRATLGLPPGFLFLFVFDFFSVLERKNPVGLIRAFARAFRPGEGPILVIKTINGDRHLADLEKVREAAADRPDILIIDAYYSAEQKNSLVSHCNCFVSLHRSEGLGLTLAEAMGLEKPVIATAYSGNVDFMTPKNSYLVDYTMGAVPIGCDPYPVGSPWAEPDLDHAAELMRRVYEAPDEAAGRAAQARSDILTKHNVDATAVILRKRIDEIRRMRIRIAPSGSSSGRIMSVNSQSDPDQTATPLSVSLSRAMTLLTPTSSVTPGRRFRGPVLFLQKLLLRGLRPYWWQQRQAQGLLIEALSEVAHVSERTAGEVAHLSERVGSSEPLHREALDKLWAAIHALGGRLDEEREARDRQDRIPEAVVRFQTSAAAHLKALTEQLASTTAQTTDLSRRLYAVPYMQDAEQFSYTGDDGKRVLGFVSGRGTGEDLYVGFEDIFRGSEPFIRERLRAYVPLLSTCPPVVEIGCGRGELLDLLKQAGVPAVGVDIDASMVQRCRAKGHNVEHADGVSFLRTQPDSSLSAIFSAQVVEHLTYDDWVAFLQLSREKLKPGGRLIFETVNPHALEAFKTFWTDLTHQRPIFPEVALAWCWLLGFEKARVLFPNGIGDLDQDRTTQGEYGVVATKATSNQR